MLPTEKKDQDSARAPMPLGDEGDAGKVCWIKPGERLRAGQLCPRCKEGIMDYNGMLHLICPRCGLTEAGACT